MHLKLRVENLLCIMLPSVVWFQVSLQIADGDATVKQIGGTAGSDRSSDLLETDIFSVIGGEDAKRQSKLLNLGPNFLSQESALVSGHGIIKSIGFIAWQKLPWGRASTLADVLPGVTSTMDPDLSLHRAPRKCRAITEMLTERVVLRAATADRVLLGAKNLLLKYTLCSLAHCVGTQKVLESLICRPVYQIRGDMSFGWLQN